MLEKLKCYKFTSQTVHWFKGYLTNRRQCVFYNGSYSEVKELQCGVPQGSCLGPLLFSIFTNDLPLVLKRARAVMYADDTTLYLPATSIEKWSADLDEELQLVVKWVRNNKMVLNLTKTKSIVFGSNSKLKLKPQLNVSVKSVPIEQVEEIRLFGVILDQGSSNLILEGRCPAEFSSNLPQHTCMEVSSIASKTLISCFRCVWLGLELNSAGTPALQDRTWWPLF